MLLRLPNWLGDIVMALPSVLAVRRTWPDRRLGVALPRTFAPLMEAVPGIDVVVPLEGRSWRDRASTARDVAALRAAGFDTALLFTNSFASARVIHEAGIRERWGYASGFRSRFLSRAIPKPRHRRGVDRHHARYYGHLVQACGAGAPDYGVRLAAPPAWTDAAADLLAARGVDAGATIVGFAPGAAYGTAKQWPPERVAAVMRTLAHSARVVPVMVGAGRDALAGSAISAELASRGNGVALVDLIGATDLPTLAGVIARCRAFVCNDSGAMHLASCLGVPVIATFGPTDEAATAPLGPHRLAIGEAWCRPCLRRECPLDHRCMTTITPELVTGLVEAALARPAA